MVRLSSVLFKLPIPNSSGCCPPPPTVAVTPTNHRRTCRPTSPFCSYRCRRHWTCHLSNRHSTSPSSTTAVATAVGRAVITATTPRRNQYIHAVTGKWITIGGSTVCIEDESTPDSYIPFIYAHQPSRLFWSGVFNHPIHHPTTPT